MSEEKERRSVSLSPENHRFLGEEGRNASELVDRLVRNYRTSGNGEAAMFRLRESQLESEVQELERRLETKRRELETVREQLAEFEDDVEDMIEDALRHIPPERREIDNSAVRNWAEKTNLAPSTLLERMAEYENADGDST